MQHHFTLAAKNPCGMFTFTMWNENHRAIAYVRGFGETEELALANAKEDLSTHIEHSAPNNDFLSL